MHENAEDSERSDLRSTELHLADLGRVRGTLTAREVGSLVYVQIDDRIICMMESAINSILGYEGGVRSTCYVHTIPVSRADVAIVSSCTE